MVLLVVSIPKHIEINFKAVWCELDGIRFSPNGHFEGHTNRILGVSFSSDCKIIVSSSDDKTVRLWRIDPEDLTLNLDAKLNNLLQKSCNWIRNYLKTNPNVSESDRTLCDKICSSQ